MPGKLFRCTDMKKRKEFKPQPHQLKVTEEFLRTEKRGILFYHALGSGKTCAAYLAIDTYRRLKGKKKVHVLSPASLASSHRHQYCNVCGESPKEFSENFFFYSYNDRAGIAKKLPPNMNDSIIIIDEVQEVINGKYNESASLSAVYDTVLNSRRCKVILLSGTPIFQPYGAVLILNLLDPGCITLDEDAFMKKMADKGASYLAPKCQGLISYVPIPDPEFYPTRVVPDIHDIVPMSEFQYQKYMDVRIDELEQIRIQDDAIQRALRQRNFARAKKLKAMQFIQQTKLKSRQLCNFAYPDDIDVKNTTDLNASWILDDDTDEHVKNLKQYSMKMAKLVHRILTLPNKHMVYGWFKSKYGLYLIYTYLKHCGIEPLLFSGDLGTDDQRQKIINQFNAEDNIRGEKYKVILVSGAGAMGISLFGIRHFHNFEASLNEFISIQAEGRAFRTMSHHQLPPEERNVQVYRYFSCLPEGAEFQEETTTEEQMYERGMIRMQQTEEILEIFRRAAFDCREPYNKKMHNKCFEHFAEVIHHEGDYDFEEAGPAFEEEEVFEEES